MEKYHITGLGIENDFSINPTKDENGEWVKASDCVDLIDALQEAAIQIEYLHAKFKVTGSGSNVLSRIETVLSTHQ